MSHRRANPTERYYTPRAAACNDRALLSLAEASSEVMDIADCALACPQCGYNLTGLPQDRCPECGLTGARERAELQANLPSFKDKKRLCLVGIVVVLAIGSLIDALILKTPRSLTGIQAVTIAFTTLAWCRYDAIEHNDRLSKTERWLIILLTPVGLACYFLNRQRWRSLLKAAIFAVTAIVASVIVEAVAFRLAHGVWPA